jgi:hypothetical protein
VTALVKTDDRTVQYTSGVVPDQRFRVKLLMVVDGSTSMEPSEDMVKQALVQLITARRCEATRYDLTYINFDSDVELRCLDKKLESVEEIEYQACGGTALYDGIKKGFDAVPERQRPVVCVVITDGADTSSKTPAAWVTKQVALRKGWGNWTFVWLQIGQTYGTCGFSDVHDFSREKLQEVLGKLTAQLGQFGQDARQLGKKTAQFLLTEARK